jgi:hypothetical protein
MKFRIEKHEEVVKTNIRGNVLMKNTYYLVYRSFLFGLIRLYVKIVPSYKNGFANEYTVAYELQHFASTFSLEEAEMLIRDIKNNPDKFVKYV